MVSANMMVNLILFLAPISNVCPLHEAVAQAIINKFFCAAPRLSEHNDSLSKKRTAYSGLLAAVSVDV